MYWWRSPITPWTTQGKFLMDTSPIFTLQAATLITIKGASDSMVKVSFLAALFTLIWKPSVDSPFVKVVAVYEVTPSDMITFTAPSLSVFNTTFPVIVYPNSICCHFGNSWSACVKVIVSSPSLLVISTNSVSVL